MSSDARRYADDPTDSVELDELGEVEDHQLTDGEVGEDEGLLHSERESIKRGSMEGKHPERHEDGEDDFEECKGGLGEDDMAETDMDAIVRKTAPTTDDPSMPSLTLRVLVLGVMFCMLGASAGQVFYFKSNAPTFSTYFVILVTFPLGHAMARYLPRRRVLGIELNPGPFNVKEHTLIGVIAQSGAGSAYASDIIAIMKLYYHRDLSMLAGMTLLITTQCLGFGLAGMVSDVLIKPTSMYWPAVLVQVQLFQALHGKGNKSKINQRRFQLFMVITTCCFVYQFLPTVFFTTLTSIATLCLVNNESWLLRSLGSGFEGTGWFDFSLDWSAVGATAPLVTPFWALLNLFGGLCGMMWIVVPSMLLFNFWNARDFPSPISAGLFTANYTKFDVTSVLNEDLSLNEQAWVATRPLLLTPYFAVTYAFSFAALTSILVHVWLWHRKDISSSLAGRHSHTDLHNKLMQAYDQVPHSWYIITLVVNFVAAIILVKTAPLQTEIWALVLAIAISTIFLVPIGIIAAVSNTTIGLNVLTEFVAGILQPGKPIMNVTFKCYGYMGMAQAISLLGDQKLGHYMHINPRHMFICQILGTIVGCIVNQIALINVIETKRPFLDGTQIDPTGQWTGRAPAVFFSASVIFGAIAPVRFFSGAYRWLYLGFPFGFAAPLVLYQLHKRFPKHHLNKVAVPLICSGATTIPQYPSNIVLTGLIAALVTNLWLAKRYPDFHTRFTYTISSALDAGTSLNAMAVYAIFSIILPSVARPAWWGASLRDSEHCAAGS